MGIIEHQLIPAHLRCHRLYTLVLTGSGLDLAQLDAEAPQLHLIVDPAQVLQLAFPVVPGQIPCPVHLFPGQERAADKSLRRQLRLFPVALRDLRAGKAQLTCHPPWQEMTTAVAYQRPGIRHSTSDGDIPIPLLVHDMVRRADGKFRRPIAIDQFDIRPFAGQHFFTAHHDIAQRQVREAVHHLHANLRGEGHSCDAVLFKVCLHAGQIPAKRFAQYMYLASQSQRAQKIIQRRIKGKAGMDRVDAFPSHDLFPPGYKGAQGAVALHDALGLSGGAGCIDHIGIAIRPGPVDESCLRTAGRHRLFICGKDLPNQCFVQNHL